MGGIPLALGLIPARAGSKSVCKKAVHPVAGRPLIGWTIAAARCSKLLDRLIVTTEDDEIADVARDHGAEVPFMRPRELARDDVPNMDAAIHALTWLDENEGYRPEYLVLLQPTSPLRLPEDIDTPLTMARDGALDAVVSVTPVTHHPRLLRHVDEQGVVAPFAAEVPDLPRRQTLAPVYAHNGAVFLVRAGILRSRRTYEPEGTRAYMMPPERSLDVDLPWDLRLAGLILAHRLRESGD